MTKLALTVKEAAEALGVSTSTIYWMCYQNEIPHNRVRARGTKGKGRILISREALEQWIRGEGGTLSHNEGRFKQI